VYFVGALIFILCSDGYLQKWATKEAIEEKKKQSEIKSKNDYDNVQNGFEFFEMKNDPNTNLEYF
jgi:hypothetical protein